jgi:hypothetical protein
MRTDQTNAARAGRRDQWWPLVLARAPRACRRTDSRRTRGLTHVGNVRVHYCVAHCDRFAASRHDSGSRDAALTTRVRRTSTRQSSVILLV